MMKNTHEILKERALKLAEVKVCQSIQEEYELIVFRLSNEIYALEMKYVREISPIKEYTSLPCVPKFIIGLMNLRRQILPIIDLRELFGLAILEKTIACKTIILKYEEHEFALLADSITGMKTVAKSEVQEALPTLTGVRSEFLKGITGEGIILLDGLKLLTSKILVVNEEAGGNSRG